MKIKDTTERIGAEVVQAINTLVQDYGKLTLFINLTRMMLFYYNGQACLDPIDTI
jgi:hypothetical protein